MNIVAQIGYSQMETWVARVYGNAKPAHMEDISSFPEYGWMPVGTVEFCRAAMIHQGIVEPAPVDYPEALRKWMPYGGHVLCRYDEMPDGWTPDHHQGIHGKPVITKLDESLWRPDTPFWASPYHRFGPEYRFYVLHGEILGYGRYDDIDDDPTDPLLLDMKAVMDMVTAYQNDGAPVGYGLDVGVSDEDGMTKLVEINDGWALGLYKGTCSQQDYLRLLEQRWSEIGSVTESGKSKDQQWSVGSNPTASAKKELTPPARGCMMYLPWRRDRLLLLAKLHRYSLIPGTMDKMWRRVQLLRMLIERSWVRVPLSRPAFRLIAQLVER